MDYLSKIVIGTWPLSGDFGKVELTAVQKTLEKAYEAGFREFDTAPNYGSGFMEMCLGKVLGDMQDIRINTKMGNLPFNRKSFDCDDLQNSFEESLQRLKRDSVNVLFLHNPRGDLNDFEAVLSYMNEWKREGKIKYTGISLAKNYAYDTKMLEQFDVIQDDVNLLYQKPLQNRYPGILMARSPLASGILSGKYTQSTVFDADDHRSGWLKGERLVSILKRVEKIRQTIGKSDMAEISRLFLLQHSGIGKVIFGIKRPEHLTDLAGMGKAEQIPESLIIELENLYKDDFGLKGEEHLGY